MPDPDCHQLHRGHLLDPLDHAAQVCFQIACRIHRQRRIVHRRAVADHHQDAAFFGAIQQAAVRPDQRLTVDVFFQQPLAHHQPKIAARAAPRFVGLFVDDVAQVVQSPRILWLAIRQPRLTALPALPRAGGKAEDFGFHPAAFQRARQNIGADRGNADRAAAHRPRIVDQQGDDGVLELDIAFNLVAERRAGRDDHAGQARRIEHAFLHVEIPTAVLLRHQPPLQSVGEPRHHALQPCQLAIEIGAQPVEFLRIAQIGRGDFLIETGGEGLVIDAGGDVSVRAVGTHRRFGAITILSRFAFGHIAIGLGLRGFVAIALALGHVARHFGGLRIALALIFVFALVVVGAVIIVSVVGIALVGGVARLGQIEFAQHIERELLERLLIGEFFRQRAEILADFLLKEGAHQFQPAARLFRHRLPRQRFAHQQRERGLQRHFGRILRTHDLVRCGAQFGCGIKIGADTAEAVGAQSLVTHLLDRVITRPRDRFGRRGFGVQSGVVMAQFQRKAIGKPARLGDLIGWQIAPRQRNAEPVARRAGHIGAPRDLNLRIACNRAARAGQRLFEQIERGLVCHSTPLCESPRRRGSQPGLACPCLMRSPPARGFAGVTKCSARSLPNRPESLRCPCRSARV